MIITKKQLEEIRRGLAVLGVRDSDLPDATTLTGAELVAIVQGNENRKVAVGDLFGKYLEGMLPYTVRGMSAYEVAVANGFTGTVEQWLASLQAAVEIDNNFEGGCYKVASAEEAKWLKESLLALQEIALTKDDVVNTLTSDASDKPLSAAMGKELKRLIGNGQSGSTVQVIDNLNSTSASAALSANQGRVLRELIERMIELSNGISNIYKWSEFQTILTAPTDTRESLVNVRVAYELYALIKDLRNRVAALENNSGSGGSGGGGSDGGGSSDVVTASLILTPTSATINATGTTQLTARYKTYKNGVEQTDLNVTSGVTWSSSNAYAAVSGGLVTGNNTSTTQERTATITARYNNKEAYSTITIRKSGDDVIDTRPKIILSPSDSIRANGDGKFIVAGVPSETTGLTVTTQNTSSDWEINQSTVPDWLEVTKGTGAVNFDIIKSAKKDVQTANVELRLVNDHDTTATVNVFFDASEDSPVPGDSEIIFRDMDGASSHTFSKLGGKVVLVVIAPSAWAFSSIPSWATLYEHETSNEIVAGSYSGTEGETLFDLVVESSDTLHDTSYINCVLVGQLDIRGGSYAIKQDPTIAGEIDILDVDGLRHMAISSSGAGAAPFMVYSTGTWTVEVADGAWLSPTGGASNWTGDATTHTGTQRTLSVASNESSSSARAGVLLATLDNTNLKRKLIVVQYGNLSSYAAWFSDSVPLSGGVVALEISAFDNPNWWVEASDVDSSIFEFPVWSEDVRNGTNVYKGHDKSIYGIKVSAASSPREVTIPVHIGSYTEYATLSQLDSQGAGQPDEQLLASTEDNVQLVNASTTSVQINVISNIEWEAEVTDGTGITISPASGTSPGGAIICSIGANTGSALREFEVTVSPKTVTAKSPDPVVVGFAQDTPTPTEMWSVSDDEVTLNADASGYEVITLSTSDDWTSELSGGFFTIQPVSGNASSSQSIVVYPYTNNPNTDSYTWSGTITLMSEGKSPIVVDVYQPPVEEGGSDDEPYLNIITPDRTEYTTAGGSGSISIESNVSWTASATGNVHISSGSSSGAGDGSVSYTFDENLLERTVTSYITVSSDSTSDAVWELEQPAASGEGGSGSEEYDASISLSPSSITRLDADAATGLEITVVITGADAASMSWVAYIDRGTITSGASGTGSGGTIVFNIPANEVTGTGATSTVSVELTASDVTGTSVAYCTVTQPAAEISIATPPAVVWPDADAHTSASVSVTVSGPGASSLSWTASSSGNHISLNTSSGTGSGSVSYDIDANDSTSSGTTGSITVTLDSDNTKTSTCTITQPSKPSPAQFTITPDSITADPTSPNPSFTVQCDYAWNITDDDGANVDVASGAANQSVTVTCSPLIPAAGITNNKTITIEAEDDYETTATVSLKVFGSLEGQGQNS